MYLRTLILLLIILGCDSPTSTKHNCGEIDRIRPHGGEIIIRVNFLLTGSSQGYHDYQWFVGSDTCKIGQKVCLR